MNGSIVCPSCKTAAFSEISKGLNNERIWKCANCFYEAILCPECEQQFVEKILVHPLGKIIFLCNECDATWSDKGKIGIPGVVNFREYYEQGLAQGEEIMLRKRGQLSTPDEKTPIKTKPR
jgi:ribosomal protein L37AE/L43A